MVPKNQIWKAGEKKRFIKKETDTYEMDLISGR